MRRISGIKDSFKAAFSKGKRGERKKAGNTGKGVQDDSQDHTLLAPQRTEQSGRASTLPPNTDGISDNNAQTPDENVSHAEPITSTEGSKSQSTDLWAGAYQEFEKREPDLASDYAKHLKSLHEGGDDDNSNGATLDGNVFSDIASAEPLVDQLLEDRKEKQWRVPLCDKNVKIRTQVEKLTKFLLWSDDIVKQALSAQPYAAMAWSGVSVLLPLISSGKIQQEAMLSGFEYIGNVQMFWKIYEDENPVHESQRPEILRSITLLYSYIVEYQARVICHLSSAQLSRTWQKLSDSNDWAGRRAKINELDERCQKLVSEAEKAHIQRQTDAQLQEMEESQAILTDIRQSIKDLELQAQLHHKNEAERAVLRDLATDYEHYKNVNPLRVEGTCEWLLNDEGFRKWRTSDTSSLLWVSAGPGSGKSVLTRCLIDEGQLSTSVTSNVCYFFFHTGTEGQMDNCSALSSILHQLFTQDPTGEMIKLGVQSHKNHGDKLRTNFMELWRLLLACANAKGSSEIICVLDALDECTEEDRGDLLQALEKYFSIGSNRSRIKFLITSRPYMDLEDAFQNYGNKSSYVRVDGDSKTDEIAKEINLTIEKKVQELAGSFSEKHRQMLTERLKGMENRTYLWLHLTFEIIKKRRAAFSKLSSIQDLLDSIPSLVSDAYESILNHNPEDQALTMALLEIVLAATRPLTLQEANYALTLATTSKPLGTHDLIDENLWPGEGFKIVVRNLSGLFITVCDSRLSFIHATAREFLTDSTVKGNWRGKVQVADSQSALAAVCLDYLTTIDFTTLNKGLKDLTVEFPFIPYSLANWPVHYRSCDKDKHHDRCKLARKMCEISAEKGKNLLQMYYDNSVLQFALEDPKDPNDLYFACYIGAEPVVHALIDELDRTSDEYVQIYQFSLSLTAMRGHADVIMTLLSSMTRAEVHKDTDSYAFAAAVEGCHIDAMRVFFDAADEIRIVDKDVIKSGMIQGDKTIVSLLLDRFGADIEMTEDVLGYAAFNSCHGLDIMRLLLEKRGHEFHITEPVVVWAAMNDGLGRDILALLLERRGSEVEITYEVLKTAARNSQCGKEIMVLLLDKRGDEISITEDLVSWAAGNSGSGLEMLKLFFEKRADETAFTEKAINAAATNSKLGDQIMAFLLEKQGSSRFVTASTMEIAAANMECGPEIMTLLLDLDPRVPVTPKVVVNAAENRWRGPDVLRLLLDRRGNGIEITENVLASAAGNRPFAKETTAILLKHKESKVVPTKPIAEVDLQPVKPSVVVISESLYTQHQLISV